MPVTFYNDHYDLLRCQNFLFARKISPEASGLKTRLLALYQSPQPTCQISDEGTYLYRSTTHSGRLGLRHGRRFWEAQATLGQTRDLLIVLCKKNAIAERLIARLSTLPNLKTLGYLFD